MLKNRNLSIAKIINSTDKKEYEVATVIAVGNKTVDIKMLNGGVFRRVPISGSASVGDQVQVLFLKGKPNVVSGGSGGGTGTQVVINMSGEYQTPPVVGDYAPTPHEALGVHHSWPSNPANQFLVTTNTAGSPAFRALILSDIQSIADTRYALRSRSIIAGNGLTGTSTLASDVTLNVGAGDGVAADADSIRVLRAATSGLSFSGGGLQIDDSVAGGGLVIASKVLSIGAGDGIAVDVDSIRVLRAATSGLSLSSGGLAVGQGNGIAVDTDSIRAVPNTAKGIAVDSSGIAVDLSATSGLEFSSGKLQINDTIAGSGIVIASKILSVNPGNGIEVASDQVKAVPNTAKGIAVDSSGIAVDLSSVSGLSFVLNVNDPPNAGKLQIDDSVAGNGLQIVSKVLKVGQGSGIEVTSDQVNIKLSDYSGMLFKGTFGNQTLSLDDKIAGPGIGVTDDSTPGVEQKVLSVSSATTIANGAPALQGLQTETNGLRLYASYSPGAASHILASDSNGKLVLPLFRATQNVSSAVYRSEDGESLTVQSGSSAPVILSPGNNLVLLPTNKVLQSDGFVSQTTGMRITNSGEGDFRYLYSDELHSKSFVTDLEQALAGGQIISKSVAVLFANYTLPAGGASSTFIVRDLPSAPGMRVFENNDWVGFRKFDRGSGGLLIGWAWGQVSNYTSLNDGTQQWTFTRSASNPGIATGVISKDSLVLDFGKSGNGYYEVNAIDGLQGANSPYAQIVTWENNPATRTARTRFGNLRGIFGITGNSVYLLTITGATSGTFVLWVGENNTGNIAFNASAATFETALTAISGLSSAKVEGTPGSYTITIPSTSANLSLFVDDSGLNSGAVTYLSLSNQTNEEYGLYAGNGSGITNRYIRASNVDFELRNVPLKIYDGANLTALISGGNGNNKPEFAMGSPLPTGPVLPDGGSGIWMGADGAGPYTYKMRVGSVAGSALNKGFLWDGTDFTIAGHVIAKSGFIEGVLTVGQSGGIYQGTGTFQSPQTGLKIYAKYVGSDLIGAIEGWKSNGINGVRQWWADSDGVLKAGADASGYETVTLSNEGVTVKTIETSTGELPTGAITKYQFSITGATGGTFRIIKDGAATSNLAYNITASSFQTALENLSTIGAGNVTVSKSGLSYIIEFVQASVIKADTSLITGTIPNPSLTALDSANITIANATTAAKRSGYRFTYDSTYTEYLGMYSVVDQGVNEAKKFTLFLDNDGSSGTRRTELSVKNTTNPSEIALVSTTNSGTTSLVVTNSSTAPGVTVNRGLNVGSATGAGTGDIHASGKIGIGTTSPAATLQIGSSLGTFNGIAIGATANRDIRVGQSSSNNVILGWKYNASASSAYAILETFNGSNSLALQTAGGNVGIGTTSPGTKLDVVGNIRASDNFYLGTGDDVYLYRSAANMLRTPDSVTIDSGVNVGTTSGAGTGEIRTSAGINAGSGNDQVRVGAHARIQAPIFSGTGFDRALFGYNVAWDNSSSQWLIGDMGANDAGGIVFANNAGMDFILHASTGASTRAMDNSTFKAGTKMRLTTGGRLGIGTGSPGYTLDVSGTLRATGDANLNSGLNVGSAQGADTGEIKASAGISATTGTFSGNITATVTNNPTLTLRSVNSGGGSRPIVKLESINNSDYFSFVYFADGSPRRTGWFYNATSEATTPVISMTSQNRLGVNKALPDYTLDVAGTIRASTGILAQGAHRDQLTVGSTNNSGAVSFIRNSGLEAGWVGFASGSDNEFDFEVSSGSGYFSWNLNVPVVGISEVMRLTNAGRLGIGTNSPNASLDVRGGMPQVSIGGVEINNAGGINIYGASNASPARVGFTSSTEPWNFVFQATGSGAGDAGFFTWIVPLSGGAPTEVMRLANNGRLGIGTNNPQYGVDCTVGSVNTSFTFRVGGTQVVTSRRTGWAAPTGTATRTTFATSTVTTAQLAERLKALIDDLTTHGLIGA